tara:strand:- start:222 stop:1217 length:996 start_codon:yes stop_codon:yes gene_type:complete
MQETRFFEKKGPFSFTDIVQSIGCSEDFSSFKNLKVYGIDSLDKARENEITFLNSSKYSKVSLETKALACITTLNLSKFLPAKCIKLNVKNTLFAVTQVSKMFYPNADLDYPDLNLIDIEKIKDKYPGVIFGKNILIGNNVEIGNKTIISSNTVIESNVKIGSNCLIGTFVVIKNSLISDNVNIQDGSKIGVKGFGFIPKNKKNLRTPHIGKVILNDGVEIGANSTIDRGSLADTVIGENTFIDNQVHIAHNVRIGKNCIIAGQVGFAGSSTLGDNVVIGGQAGISGHLKIGSNVKIGGGSGVIQNIPDNSQVMGYPAVPLKEFVKQRRSK